MHLFFHPSIYPPRLNHFIHEVVDFVLMSLACICNWLIVNDFVFVTYFRQVLGLSSLNDAIKKLESELESLVEAGESF
jgi:hypothetical protein